MIAIHFPINTCHSRISAVLQCAVCCSFSITRALTTAVTAFVFSCLFTALLFSLKKWAYPKFERVLASIVTIDSSAFRARVYLFFFLEYKVVSCVLTFIFEVKDWITISSVKGYHLLSYVFPQRKYYTPYGKLFFQILPWGINAKATHNCSSGLVSKNKKRKENIMGLRGDQSP